MPPYSSQIDGSVRVVSALNSSKHGSGKLIVQDGCEFFGAGDQHIQSSSSSSDLFVGSKKNINIGATDTLSVNVGCVGQTTTLKGAVQVDQASTFTGAVTASSSLAVTGISTLTGAASCGSTLAVTGSTTLSDTLSVAGTSTFAKGVTMSETLAVTGTSEFTGDVAAKGALVVDTTTQLKGDLQCDTNVVVAGNLTVSGTTVTVNSEQVLIRDNLLVLNSTGLENKDSGLLFKRSTGVDNEAFFFDESDNTFVLATTESLHDSATVTVKSLSKLKCAGIESDQAISQPGLATTTVDLAGDSSVPVSIPGVTATRGSYEFIIESDSDLHPTGSVYNYKIVKNSAASASYASFGVHQAGDSNEQVYVSWAAGEAPKLYHKDLNASASPIKYNIKYMRVN